MVRRETVRDGMPAGVEVAVADFDDAASVTAALQDAGQAYLVTPSSERAGSQQRRFADLAARAVAGHLVVLSQLASDEKSPVRFLRYHAEVEKHVRALGIGYTFLRPNLFFQGLLAFAGMISAEGRFYAPIGDAKVSAIDVRDIAAVAAVTLAEPGHEGATYTLTGPAAITHQDMAAALSAALGRDIFSPTSRRTPSPPACPGSCRRGRSTACWRITRITGADRPRSAPESRAPGRAVKVSSPGRRPGR
jgi:uncharacterized protein YbjT (DUF2867 family)